MSGAGGPDDAKAVGRRTQVCAAADRPAIHRRSGKRRQRDWRVHVDGGNATNCRGGCQGFCAWKILQISEHRTQCFVKVEGFDTIPPTNGDDSG